MNNFSLREKQIVGYVRREKQAGSSDVYNELTKRGERVSLVTIKRTLSRLESQNILTTAGAGPSTAYFLSDFGKLIIDIYAAEYCSQEPDKCYGARGYNFNLFSALNFDLFSQSEKTKLDFVTDFYLNKISDISETIHKKELERFVIELSWKSSKIEGNTYTLLDTERLILHGIEAPGHSKDEAVMILNHKKAFSYIHEHKEKFKTLTRSNIEDVHKIITGDLSVKTNLRSKPVGIVGSIYRPLDNQQQIGEAVEALSGAVSRMPHSYAKAFVSLLGISYIQPFEDGNKRTARMIANAILLAHGLAPLSYRSVEEKDYREAMLVFYELNSLIPFKKIFIDQYEFAAKNYLAV
ncbi:MAG: Fic family protein [Patescibacteria group bacterium]